MLTALVLVLAQAAAAQPTPTPTLVRGPTPTSKPTGAPTAIPRAEGLSFGLSGAASRVKLNRNVTFDDVPTAKPTPPRVACEAGSFRAELNGYASRFAGELKTARLTPRMALAGQISRLRSLRADLLNAGTKAPKCAIDAITAGIIWMDLEISALDEFLGKSEAGAQALSEHAAEALERFEAERQALR